MIESLTLDTTQICNAGVRNTKTFLRMRRKDTLEGGFRIKDKATNRYKLIGLYNKSANTNENGVVIYEDLWDNTEPRVETDYLFTINQIEFAFQIGGDKSGHITLADVTVNGEVTPSVAPTPGNGGTTPVTPAGTDYDSFAFVSQMTNPTTLPAGAMTFQTNTHSYNERITIDIDDDDYIILWIDPRTLPTDLINSFGSHRLPQWNTGETVMHNSIEYHIYRLPAANMGGAGTFTVRISK